MSRYLSPRLAALDAYTPGEQPRDMQYIKLNTNESPFPPSPLVLEKVSEAEVGRLNLYPDPEATFLRQKLAALHGLKPENVFVSNGSDDILNFAFMAFCDENRGAAFADITYGFYPVYGDLYGIDCKVMSIFWTISKSSILCYYCRNIIFKINNTINYSNIYYVITSSFNISFSYFC